HCKASIDVIESTGLYNIVGIVDQTLTENDSVFGYPIIGADSDLPALRKLCDNAFITVGQIKSSNIRKNIFKLLLDLGFNLPSIVASTAYIGKNVSLGIGTIVMHHALVNANSFIGENCIINTKALVEHDCAIGDNTHVSTATVINGTVKIGSDCFIGSATSFVNNINVTNNVFIGINSLINKSITEPGVYIGNPIRKIK
ncbi:MAG: NeuD/PglB/VioB family sugar acetyltransferase, partial [Putridiphycobacter sp.]|nr:NeuD/PglB/VioB family sugar acetyltransferase [Putridiphycobacter sp.]